MLYVSIGIIIFGLIFKRFYVNGIAHNSISFPIIILGIILFILSAYGKFEKKEVTSVFNLTIDQVNNIEIVSSYNKELPKNKIISRKKDIQCFLETIKKSNLNRKQHEITLWYYNLQVNLKSGEILYATLYKREKGFVFTQVYKYFFIKVPDIEFQLIDDFEFPACADFQSELFLKRNK